MEPFVREYFEKGEVVLAQGDIGDCAYFIVNETADVEVSSPGTSQSKKLLSCSW